MKRCISLCLCFLLCVFQSVARSLSFFFSFSVFSLLICSPLFDFKGEGLREENTNGLIAKEATTTDEITQVKLI